MMAEERKYKKHMGTIWIKNDSDENFWCTGNIEIALLKESIEKFEREGYTQIGIKMYQNKFKKTESHPDFYIDEDPWRLNMQGSVPSKPDPNREPAPF